MSIGEIIEVISELARKQLEYIWNNYANVVGYSNHYHYKEVDKKKVDTIAVVVYVSKKVEIKDLNIKDIIPKFITDISGVKDIGNITIATDVVVLGELKALNIFQDPKGTYRPFCAGESIGHKDITAGTIKCFTENKEGKICIESNNHVQANCNLGEIGDSITQAGPYDTEGYKENLTVAKLYAFKKIEFLGESNCSLSNFVCKVLNGVSKLLGRKTRFNTALEVYNRIDIALGEIYNGVAYNLEVNGLVPVKEIVKFKVGDRVIKSGRTTGITIGTVIDTAGVVTVSYPPNTAIFENQVIIQKVNEGDSEQFSAGGDSGSGIYLCEEFKSTGKLGATLFAGSDTSTIANNEEDIEEWRKSIGAKIILK